MTSTIFELVDHYWSVRKHVKIFGLLGICRMAIDLENGVYHEDKRV